MSEQPPTDTDLRRERMRNHPAYRLPVAAAALRDALEDRDADWCASTPQTPSLRTATCLDLSGARGPVRFITAAEWIAKYRGPEAVS